MACILLKPGEPTMQDACTKCVQFTINNDDSDLEVLDITVDQRSSDVILGLPHDACCWSIILHLVRREVYMLSRRRLGAGKVTFMIAAGAAYVYDINQVEFQELRKREPKVLNELPELIIEKDKGMFEEAREFHESMLRVKGYSILTIQV
jgi:thymidylate synthase